MSWKSAFIVPPPKFAVFLFDEQRKLCEKCLHCSIKIPQSQGPAQWNCTVEDRKSITACSFMRYPGQKCGPDGKLFKGKV